MGLTVVPGNMIQDGTVTDSNFTNTTITSADMQNDPRNASNYTSGSVPLAQLGNVPATDTTGLDDDIALLGFKTAANGSLGKYDLLDQTVDAFEDASGVDANASTNEVRDSSGKYYSGVATVPANATGGIVTNYGSYTVNTFLTSGNFVVPGGSGNVDVLVVAGGGGGGYQGGGGGGAGGVLTFASQSLTAQSYTITVGAGGGGSTAAANKGTDGGDSKFGSLTTVDGGGGGGSLSNKPGAAGGSGGGTGKDGNASGGAATSGQGYAGGASAGSSSDGSGGGGGASAVGQDSGEGGYSDNSGDGGVGLENAYRTGSNVFYGGGGGGGANNSAGNWSRIADGGNGGGGDGGLSGPANGSNPTAPVAGTDGLGGGGGGGAWNVGIPASFVNGADGGDGIVVVRYTTNTFQTDGVGDMTLVSTATTAQAIPTKGDMVMTYTDGAGTAVINTNIKGYVSRDGGTTYTQGTLVSQGTTGGHTIASFHDLDISGQPSGQSMRYKIETLVQSAAMDTRIQAVSLGWS